MTTHHAPLPLGTCTLVGAGPGDPELLTLKAVKAIQAATVLLVSTLIGQGAVMVATRRSASGSPA